MIEVKKVEKKSLRMSYCNNLFWRTIGRCISLRHILNDQKVIDIMHIKLIMKVISTLNNARHLSNELK